VRGLRIAWSPRLGYVERIDPEVEQAAAKAARVFEDLGASVEEVDPGLPDSGETIRAIWAAVSATVVDAASASDRAKMDPGFVRMAGRGRAYSLADYLAAQTRRGDLINAMLRFHERYDLLLTPTMECVAFPLSEWAPRELDGQPIGEFYDDYCHFCYPFNLTGQPAISVPMAPGSGGLPLGLQIVGRRFEDDVVLRAAAAWERAQPWETASLAPAPERPAPGELVAAAAAGERVATIAGTEAWALDAPVRAGELFALGDGRNLRAVRAWSPRAGELEVSFQLEP
jgi:aspartyl-tRNA(Asn)/glutamyl-tRNA(Gln) amidotransferase subunit A